MEEEVEEEEKEEEEKKEPGAGEDFGTLGSERMG